MKLAKPSGSLFFKRTDRRVHAKRSPLVSVALMLAFSFVLSACGGSGGDDEVATTKVVDGLPVLRGLTPDLPQADLAFESNHYAGNAMCSSCHTDESPLEESSMAIKDESGFRDLSIGKAWETSLMANSTRDPYWHAAIAAELHTYPSLKDEINDTCTRCHAPMANDLAKKEGIPFQFLDSGSEETGDFVQGFYSMDSTSELFNHAMDGVSCSLCHQVADDGNLGTDQGMSGGWVVIEYPEENIDERPAYGQYQDVDVSYMREQSGYTPQYGAHISTSETCGSCHNLKTNPVDKNGEPVEGVTHFAEQMVYTEWENSAFDVGKPQEASCQSCHMPKVEESLLIATAGATKKRDNFAEHTFLGANTVMQSMLMNFSKELGVPETVTAEDFQESIERNRAFLKTSATLEVQNKSYEDGKLKADVKITNLTGHKLPSGYHTRRVYLHVLVTDADGQVVYENGRMKSDGSIVGVSEDANPNSYEIHYDKITSATQVQVYQAIPGDQAGNITHSLLAATQFLKDNRLTPAGFDKNVVPEDVAVHGSAATDDDFNNGTDIISYEMSVQGKAPFTTLVELRYQPLSFGSLMSLFALSDKVDQVDMFRTIYDSTTFHHEVIDSITETIE